MARNGLVRTFDSGHSMQSTLFNLPLRLHKMSSKSKSVRILLETVDTATAAATYTLTLSQRKCVERRPATAASIKARVSV